jgi:hypothetical protein
MFVDNRSAIDVAYNPEHHGRMKHVERRHFFIRELVEDHRMRATFVRSVDNLADFFTKVLHPKTFKAMRDIIMNDPGTHARGGVDTSVSGVLSASSSAGARDKHACARDSKSVT